MDGGVVNIGVYSFHVIYFYIAVHDENEYKVAVLCAILEYNI